MLVGFFEYSRSDLEHATDGVDRAYDGLRIISGNYVDIYSLINEKAYAIQGRSALNILDVIPIGFNANITGTLKISIDKLEGALAGSEIYLEDKLVHANGEYHVLSDSGYEFDVTETGTFDDRFNLRFSSSSTTLDIEEEEVLGEQLIISNLYDEIYMKSVSGVHINEIIAYDLLGRQLIRKPFDNSELLLNAHFVNKGTVLIFKVVLDDGKVFTRKFIKL